jgi:hypothetical protein
MPRAQILLKQCVLLVAVVEHSVYHPEALLQAKVSRGPVSKLHLSRTSSAVLSDALRQTLQLAAHVAPSFLFPLP